MKNVIVYSTTTCPYCHMLKEFLNEHNISYQDIDVGKDRNGLIEMKEKSGQLGVPVIDIDGKIIVGFDRDTIARELGVPAAAR